MPQAGSWWNHYAVRRAVYKESFSIKPEGDWVADRQAWASSLKMILAFVHWSQLIQTTHVSPGIAASTGTIWI
jgi:hypothetical protein